MFTISFTIFIYSIEYYEFELLLVVTSCLIKQCSALVTLTSICRDISGRLVQLSSQRTSFLFVELYFHP